MSRRAFVHAAVLCLAGVAGCSDAGPRETAAEAGPALASRRARGPVVARVDGVPLGLDDVRELAARLDLEPRDALRRLEDELLLLAESRRRGFGRAPTATERRQGAVRALLAAVEAEVPVPDLDEARLRAAFEAGGDVEAPERRATQHVALLPPEEAAAAGDADLAARRELGRGLLAELRAGSLAWDDLVRPLEASGGVGTVRGTRAQLRTLDAFHAGEATVPEAYRAAAFAGDTRPGVRPDVLEIDGVVLLLRVTDREPERRRDYAAFAESQRARAHAAATSRTLQSLVHERGVGRLELEEQELARLLASDGPFAALTAPPEAP